MGDSITLLMVLAAIATAVGLWSLFHRSETIRAKTGSDGVQQLTIVVRGRYRPSTVVVERGIPVRLLFDRQEDQVCSERVIFSAFQHEHWLAPFAITTVQFIPTRAGEFLFTCALGMYQGRLVVREPRAERWTDGLLRTRVSSLRSPGKR